MTEINLSNKFELQLRSFFPKRNNCIFMILRKRQKTDTGLMVCPARIVYICLERSEGVHS